MLVDVLGADIDQLKSEITRGREERRKQEEVNNDLKELINEIEVKLNSNNDDVNEWKTRYENQIEWNNYLDRQIRDLTPNIEKVKQRTKEAREENALTNSFDHVSDISSDVDSIIAEKNYIVEQLRDYEWRLEQESKAYHKTNEERKMYLAEIAAIKSTINIDNKKTQQTLTYQTQSLNNHNNNYQGDVTNTNYTYSSQLNKFENLSQSTSNLNTYRNDDMTYRHRPTIQSSSTFLNSSIQSHDDFQPNNIPMNQRIIDTSKGPIRKEATVKKLPKVDYD
ncbi:hypothetical protein SNEBB_007900 [Seison nebaliae]|nr:hypothetical protein SNEBB_007900 [Seison nebaliae]